MFARRKQPESSQTPLSARLAVGSVAASPRVLQPVVSARPSFGSRHHALVVNAEHLTSPGEPSSGSRARPARAAKPTLSNLTVQRNDSLESWRAAVEASCPVGATESRATTAREKRWLDAIASELQEATEGIHQVRSIHRAFVESLRASGPAVVSAEPAGEDQASARAGGEQAAPENDPDGAEEEALPGKSGRSTSPRRGRTADRQQLLVMAQFDRLDEGDVDRQRVFEEITNKARRVETKMDYFRDRTELVLPRIEERFMIRDVATGCLMVDVAKLCNQTANVDPSSSSSYDPFGSTSSMREGLCPHDVSLSTFSIATRSMESWHERDQRLREAAAARKEHACGVRQLAHSRQLDRRILCHHALVQKAHRQEDAERLRRWLKWLICAIYARALEEMYREYREGCKAMQESALAAEKNLARMTITEPTATKSIGEDYWAQKVEVEKAPRRNVRLAVKTKLRLATAVQVKYVDTCRLKKREHVQKMWWRVMRCMIFLAKLSRKHRCTRSAEILSEFLEASWRGFRVRSSMRNFYQHIVFLQRGMRAYARMKVVICKFIYAPAVWECETEILCKITDVPKQAVDHVLATHRTANDTKRVLREIHNISTQRTEYLLDKQKARAAFTANASAKRGKRHKRGGMRQLVISGLPHVSALGQCIEYEGYRAKHVHPMLAVMDKYRLPEKPRRRIVEQAFVEAMNRWMIRWKEYKRELAEFKKAWLHWRLDCVALGAYHRDIWPPMPKIPVSPAELTHVKPAWFHKAIHKELLNTSTAFLM